jgi:hypothetical protein
MSLTETRAPSVVALLLHQSSRLSVEVKLGRSAICYRWACSITATCRRHAEHCAFRQHSRLQHCASAQHAMTLQSADTATSNKATQIHRLL